LDSLMGQARNAGKEERKKKKRGESFKDDTVCKFQLVGFCPEHEDLFHNTKRDIGECRKTHFEISKEEFDNHPEKARYKAEYETLLLRHLEAHVRRADDWAAKERQKNELASQKQAELGGNEVARQEIDKLNDMAGKLYAEAENLASAGKVELSKAKVLLAEQLQKKKADWEAKARDAPAAEVCEVCGLTKENDAGAEKGNKFTHTEGKVHQGFLLIRKWYAELREKQKRGELDIKANTSRDSREDSDRRQQKKHGEARAEDESNQKSDVGRDGREADRRREQESGRRSGGDDGDDGRRRRVREDDRYGGRYDGDGGGDDGRRRRARENDAHGDTEEEGRRRRRREVDQGGFEPRDRRHRREYDCADGGRPRRRY